MAPWCGCLPHFRKEREGEDRKRPSQGGQASGRPPDPPSSRLLGGPFLQEAFEMHFICDSGYRSVGLHDFFQKGICSLNGGLAAWGTPAGGVGSMSRSSVSCWQDCAPARLPRHPTEGGATFPLWSPESRPAQWVSSGMVVPPRGCLTMSGNSFGCHTWGWHPWQPVGGGQVLFSGPQSRAGLPTE